MAGHSSSVIGNTMVVFGGSLGARQMYEHYFHFYYILDIILHIAYKNWNGLSG